MKLPENNNFPSAEAGLREIGRFVHEFDPTQDFIELWGDDYRTKVETLWQEQLKKFRAGERPAADVRELLLVLAYQYAIAPYSGIPENVLLDFSRWLISGMRAEMIKNA